MKQTIKPYTVSNEHEINTKKLKGKATIQLFNSDGKEIYSKTEENLVTNAVSDLINGGLFLQTANTWYAQNKVQIIANNRPLGKNMFGGLMLFRSEIEEDANKYLLPTDSICVGTAGTTQTDNVNMGSYSATESETTEDGFKMVWDFKTSQCNDTISAIALTSIAHGNTGLIPSVNKGNDQSPSQVNYNFSSPVTGYTEPTSQNPPIFIDSNATVSEITETKINNSFPFYISPVIGSSQYMVVADIANMKIIAYALKTPCARKITDTNSGIVINSKAALQIDVSTLSPAPATGCKTFGITVDGTGFYLLYPTGTRQFAKKHYTWQSVEIKSDFDLENPTKVIVEDTAASATVATTFDVLLAPSNVFNTFGFYDTKSGNYVISNTSGVAEVVDSTTGNTIAHANYTLCGANVSSCGSLYQFRYRPHMYTSNLNNEFYQHIDLVAGTELSADGSETLLKTQHFTVVDNYYYPGAGSPYHSYGTLSACYIADGVSDKGRIAKISGRGYSSQSLGYYIKIITPAYYLATINNITPVTKTNATTMKITYEISNATEMAPEM